MKKVPIPIEELKKQAEACKACLLHEGRTNIVFGEGNTEAQIMLIGEAPGKNEDLEGSPFVGKAGSNLNALLELADIKRKEIYIANVLKCRPPSNRNPKVEEIQACSNFLREQTRTIGPEYIITLGNFATQFILKTDVGISSLRGKIHLAGNLKVFPVFHPAAAIYDRSKQSILEEDFKKFGEIITCENVKKDAK